MDKDALNYSRAVPYVCFAFMGGAVAPCNVSSAAVVTWGRFSHSWAVGTRFRTEERCVAAVFTAVVPSCACAPPKTVVHTVHYPVYL